MRIFQIFNAFLNKNNENPKEIPIGTPLDWVLEHQTGHFSSAFKELTNNELPEMIFDALIGNSTNNDCIKQLMFVNKF